jgi:NAD(P)-dependent dehydrogenase (short-subunit alcohol dehydrogenase family)
VVGHLGPGACLRCGVVDVGDRLADTGDGVDNLVALVTGTNKGIGKEIARQLADAGFTVYVGSRDAARGERAVEEIGGDTRLLVLDVTDDASIADAARQAGTLDILVNNAEVDDVGAMFHRRSLKSESKISLDASTPRVADSN